MKLDVLIADVDEDFKLLKKADTGNTQAMLIEISNKLVSTVIGPRTGECKRNWIGNIREVTPLNLMRDERWLNRFRIVFWINEHLDS